MYKYIQNSKPNITNVSERKDNSNCRALRPNRRDTTTNEITKQPKKKSPNKFELHKNRHTCCKTLPAAAAAPEALCCGADKNRKHGFPSLEQNTGQKCATFLPSLARKDIHSVKGAKTGYMLTLGAHKFVSFFSSLSNLTKNNPLWVHLDIC
jgi:hypothetical protein